MNPKKIKNLYSTKINWVNWNKLKDLKQKKIIKTMGGWYEFKNQKEQNKNNISFFWLDPNTRKSRKINTLQEAKILNKNGVNIYYPKNIFYEKHSENNLLAIKSFGWDFDFANKKQKNKVIGDLKTIKFWEQYLEQENIQKMFKTIFKRKQKWEEIFSIVNTYKWFHISIKLDKKLKNLKKKYYKEFHTYIQNKLKLPFLINNNGKIEEIEIQPDKGHNSLTGILKVPGFIDNKKWRDWFYVNLVKKATKPLYYKTFKRMLKETMAHWNTKNIINKNAHKNKSKDKQIKTKWNKTYTRSKLRFWDSYKSRVNQGGIEAGAKWFCEGTNNFYKKISNWKQFKQYKLDKLQLKPLNDIKEKIKIVDKKTGLNKVLDWLILGTSTISDFNFFDPKSESQCKTNPLRLFKKRVISHHIDRLIDLRKDINSYNYNDTFKLYNTWLKCLNVSWKKNSKKELTEVPQQVAKDTHNNAPLVKKILDDKNVVSTKHITTTWTDFIKLTGGTFKMQQEWLNWKNIKINTTNGLNGWTIAPFKEVAKMFGKNNYNSQKKLQETFKRCGSLYKETKINNKWFRIQHIKLLDEIILYDKKTMEKILKTEYPNNPILKNKLLDWEHYQTKFVALKISKEYREHADNNFFAKTMSIPAKLYKHNSKYDIRLYLLIKFGLIGRSSINWNKTKIKRENIIDKLGINSDNNLVYIFSRLEESWVMKIRKADTVGYVNITLLT